MSQVSDTVAIFATCFADVLAADFEFD